MDISLIVAADENDLIGREGALPWRLPADLRHFKDTTMGKPIVMGRRTHESIGRALPGRHNIVITRQPGYRAQGCTVVGSLEAALDAALAADAHVAELLIIGGAAIYRESLGLANRIYLTRIHAAFQGDTYFPEIDYDEWIETAVEEHAPDEQNVHAYSFEVLERRM